MTVRIEPSPARYSIQESFNGFNASIPARRNWFALLFMCAWLGGWVLGEASAISELFHVKIEILGDYLKSSRAPAPAQLFLALWLVVWTLGGAFAFFTILWQLFGREIIGVEAGELLYRVEALGIGRTRAFAGDRVERLRAIDMNLATSSRRTTNWMRAPTLFGQGVGSVAFDYGARTYRMGSSLDDAEARLLIQQLKRWLPEGAIAG